MLNDAELFVGKTSLAEDPELYRLALEQLEKRLTKALRGMESGEEDSPRQSLYRDIEKQVKEIMKTI